MLNIFSATKFSPCVSNVVAVEVVVVEVQGSGGDIMMVERFSTSEMSALRNELLEGGLDNWQAAELLQMFLVGRGYGVSPEAARTAASRVEGAGCSIESLQRELEKLALVM